MAKEKGYQSQSRSLLAQDLGCEKKRTKSRRSSSSSEREHSRNRQSRKSDFEHFKSRYSKSSRSLREEECDTKYSVPDRSRGRSKNRNPSPLEDLPQREICEYSTKQNDQSRQSVHRQNNSPYRKFDRVSERSWMDELPSGSCGFLERHADLQKRERSFSPDRNYASPAEEFEPKRKRKVMSSSRRGCYYDRKYEGDLTHKNMSGDYTASIERERYDECVPNLRRKRKRSGYPSSQRNPDSPERKYESDASDSSLEYKQSRRSRPRQRNLDYLPEKNYEHDKSNRCFDYQKSWRSQSRQRNCDYSLERKYESDESNRSLDYTKSWRSRPNWNPDYSPERKYKRDTRSLNCKESYRSKSRQRDHDSPDRRTYESGVSRYGDYKTSWRSQSRERNRESPERLKYECGASRYGDYKTSWRSQSRERNRDSPEGRKYEHLASRYGDYKTSWRSQSRERNRESPERRKYERGISRYEDSKAALKSQSRERNRDSPEKKHGNAETRTFRGDNTREKKRERDTDEQFQSPEKKKRKSTAVSRKYSAPDSRENDIHQQISSEQSQRSPIPEYPSSSSDEPPDYKKVRTQETQSLNPLKSKSREGRIPRKEREPIYSSSSESSSPSPERRQSTSRKKSIEDQSRQENTEKISPIKFGKMEQVNKERRKNSTCGDETKLNKGKQTARGSSKTDELPDYKKVQTQSLNPLRSQSPEGRIPRKERERTSSSSESSSPSPERRQSTSRKKNLEDQSRQEDTEKMSPIKFDGKIKLNKGKQTARGSSKTDFPLSSPELDSGGKNIDGKSTSLETSRNGTQYSKNYQSRNSPEKHQQISGCPTKVSNTMSDSKIHKQARNAKRQGSKSEGNQEMVNKGKQASSGSTDLKTVLIEPIGHSSPSRSQSVNGNSEITGKQVGRSKTEISFAKFCDGIDKGLFNACPWCGQICTDEEFKEHVSRQHLTEQEFIYSCHLCDYQERDFDIFTKHTEEIHQRDRKKIFAEERNDIRKCFQDALSEGGKGLLTQYRFKKLLEVENMKEVVVDGNGFCFISCLLITMAEQNIPKTFETLSIEIMSELRNHVKHYTTGFLEPTSPEVFLETCAAFFQRGIYSHEWIDICIAASANALGVNLNIFEKKGNYVSMTKYDCSRYSSNVNLFLQFYGKKKQNKNLDSHYNCYVKGDYFKTEKLAIRQLMVQSPEPNAVETRGKSNSSTDKSITDMLEEQMNPFVTVLCYRDEYDEFFSKSNLFEIVTDGDLPILSLRHDTRNSDTRTSKYTTGSQRGKFVPSVSDKNVLYGKDFDVSSLQGDDLRKYQAAMRARRKRQRLKAEKEGGIRQRKWRERKIVKRLLNAKKHLSKQNACLNSANTNTVMSPSHLSNASEYVTPPKYRKQIRQRTHDCNKSLPGSPGLAAAVMNRLVKKMLKSPSTKVAMRSVMALHKLPEQNRDAKFLTSTLLKIRKYRTTKNTVKLNESVKDLKRKCSIRSAAKILNMHNTHLQRLTSQSKSRSQRAVGKSKVRALKFYQSNRITLQLPYKKYAKFYYLRSPLAVAYDVYVKEQTKLGFRILSQSAVYRCLKGKVRTMKKVPFKDCQCDTCLNNSLLVDALIVAKVKGIKRRITQNILLSFCSLNKKLNDGSCRKLEWEEDVVVTDHNRDCIFRDCELCGAIRMQEIIAKLNSGYIDWSKVVTWHQWKYVKLKLDQKEGNCDKKKSFKLMDKIRYTGSVAQLLTLFTMSINELSIHQFHFRWQSVQFDECKNLLQIGDILLVIDFGQNYSHHRQDEIQTAYYSRRQTTLHPVMIYYCCLEKCGCLVRDEVMIMSDDLKHDSSAVNAFIQKVLAHLAEKKVPVNRLIIWSDNCGAQYKSCKVFDAVSKFDIPVMRNYFCAKHGKAEADGFLGRFKMHIDAVVRSGTQEFRNATEIASYCQKKLTIDGEPGKCCHYRKHFYLVDNIDHDGDDTDPQTVQGTLKFHSIRNTGTPGIIEVRESSCFCEVCFLNHSGECKNKHLVKPFAWAPLYKTTRSSANFKNTLWGTDSSAYRYKPMNKKEVGIRFQKEGNTVLKVGKEIIVTTDSESESHIEWNTDDTDFEENLPLAQLIEPNLNTSPVCYRTRKRLHENKFVRCGTQFKALDISDYEADVIVDDMDVYPLEQSIVSPNVLFKNSTPKRDKLPPISFTPSPVPNHSEHPSLIDLTSEIEIDLKSKKGSKLKNFGWNKLYNDLVACKDFEKLTEIVKKAKLPQLPKIFTGDNPINVDRIDKSGFKYIPSDTDVKFLLHHPVEIAPDGNCFVRSLSRLVYGRQDYHLEMRCRIVVDSVLHMNNYTDHKYLMRGATHVHKNCTHIGALYCFYSGVQNVGNRDSSNSGIISVFKDDVLRVRMQSNYCGLWQMHSAANVLNSKLVVLFPEKHIRKDVRVDMHRVFLPSNSECEKVQEFALLWTSFNGNAGGQQRVKYDHIEPLIRRGRLAVRLQKTPVKGSTGDAMLKELKKENEKAKKVRRNKSETEKSVVKEENSDGKITGKGQKTCKTKQKKVSDQKSNSDNMKNECGKSDSDEINGENSCETTKDSMNRHSEMSVETEGRSGVEGVEVNGKDENFTEGGQKTSKQEKETNHKSSEMDNTDGSESGKSENSDESNRDPCESMKNSERSQEIVTDGRSGDNGDNESEDFSTGTEKKKKKNHRQKKSMECVDSDSANEELSYKENRKKKKKQVRGKQRKCDNTDQQANKSTPLKSEEEIISGMHKVLAAEAGTRMKLGQKHSGQLAGDCKFDESFLPSEPNQEANVKSRPESNLAKQANETGYVDKDRQYEQKDYEASERKKNIENRLLVENNYNVAGSSESDVEYMKVPTPLKSGSGMQNRIRTQSSKECESTVECSTDDSIDSDDIPLSEIKLLNLHKELERKTPTSEIRDMIELLREDTATSQSISMEEWRLNKESLRVDSSNRQIPQSIPRQKKRNGVSKLDSSQIDDIIQRLEDEDNQTESISMSDWSMMNQESCRIDKAQQQSMPNLKNVKQSEETQPETSPGPSKESKSDTDSIENWKSSAQNRDGRNTQQECVLENVNLPVKATTSSVPPQLDISTNVVAEKLPLVLNEEKIDSGPELNPLKKSEDTQSETFTIGPSKESKSDTDSIENWKSSAQDREGINTQKECVLQNVDLQKCSSPVEGTALSSVSPHLDIYSNVAEQLPPVLNEEKEKKIDSDPESKPPEESEKSQSETFAVGPLNESKSDTDSNEKRKSSVQNRDGINTRPENVVLPKCSSPVEGTRLSSPSPHLDISSLPPVLNEGKIGSDPELKHEESAYTQPEREEKIHSDAEVIRGKSSQNFGNDVKFDGKSNTYHEFGSESDSEILVRKKSVMNRIARETEPAERSDENQLKISQSDTTATSQDCESDSEPENVIVRKRKNHENENNDLQYLLSGKKYGFPLRKILPSVMIIKCNKQEWPGIKIVHEIKEGRGVFASKCFKKGSVICNYGGTFISEEYAKKWLLPFENKCDYLVEMHENFNGKAATFYLNHDNLEENSYGKFLNHSQLHPNLKEKVYVTQEKELDVIFFAKRDIEIGEQLVWNYGKKFSGVNACVESCCKGTCGKAKRKLNRN